ncbi:MAG: transposase [Candidatus Bathyarchaeia archaeon]
MDWRSVDERLIKCGELILSLDFVNAYDFELKALNDGKVGRPFKLIDRYAEFLAIVRYLFSMPYRQIEDFTKALNRLIPRLPSADHSWVRRRISMLNQSPYDSLGNSNEPVVIAIDSSGVKVHKAGGWVTRIHGGKKRYIKIHFAVNVKTKEILAMDVTTDDIHDSKALPTLITDAYGRRVIGEAYMDGAYDSAKAYRLFRRMGIEADHQA